MSTHDQGNMSLPQSPPLAASGHQRHVNSPGTQEQNNVHWTADDHNPFRSPQGDSRSSRRFSQLPLAPDQDGRDRRDSDATLGGLKDPYERYTLSSYQHPYDIAPPPHSYNALSGNSPSVNQSRSPRRSVSFAKKQEYIRIPEEEELLDLKVDPNAERAEKRRGIPSQMLDLHSLKQRMRHSDGEDDDFDDDAHSRTRRPAYYSRRDSTFSNSSQVLDPDDPLVTGNRARYLDDLEDIEKNALRQMDYRSRRKHLMRVKIEFNVTCMPSAVITRMKCLPSASQQ